MFIERNPVCKVRSKEFIIPVSETGALDIENDTELFQGHSKTTQKRQEQVSQIPWLHMNIFSASQYNMRKITSGDQRDSLPPPHPHLVPDAGVELV